MGAQKSYRPSGGFSEYLYHQVGEAIVADGMSGKVIKRTEQDNTHDGLPLYSNSSRVYFKLDKERGIIEQARVYDGRRVVLDFDWGHTHKDYKEGTVHVHIWHINDKGKWVRGAEPRLMNNEEIKFYGNLLRKANPNVRFR